MLRLQNRPAAKESNAGDDSLNGAADRVDMQRRRIESHHDQRHQRRPKRHQRMRPHPRRLPPHFAIEPDASADRRRRKKAKDDLRGVSRESEHREDCFTARAAGGGRRAKAQGSRFLARC